MVYFDKRSGTINIAFLNQGYLIQRETIAALRRVAGVRLVAIDIVSSPDRKSVV
jgi:hypothetical protein